MYGAIIGDTVGSRFEWNSIKTKDFEFYHEDCSFTDDSAMSLAVARSIMECYGDYSLLNIIVAKSMRQLGMRYPDAGYGGRFRQWLANPTMGPYNSLGNGSAMRVSACGWAGKDLDEVKMLSRKVTEVTHNHPEGIKGAEAVACAIYLARTGSSMEDIKKYINENYYKIDFTLDDIRDEYKFDVTCQGSVPEAFEAFFESTSFEDAIRNAISLGGDADTQAAIAGSIAEAYYGIPKEFIEKEKEYLDDYQIEILNSFELKHGNKII